MSISARSTAQAAIFWLLAIPVSLLLLFALFMALEGIIVFGPWEWSSIKWRLAFLVWPIPQIFGLVAAMRRNTAGDFTLANYILAIQFAITGVVTAAFIGYVSQ